MRCDAMQCIQYTKHTNSGNSLWCIWAQTHTTHKRILCDCCVCAVCTNLFTNELIFMCTSSISVWFWIRIGCFIQFKWINSWNFAIEVLWLDRQAVAAEFFITTSEIKWCCLMTRFRLQFWTLFDSTKLHSILNAYRTTCSTVWTNSYKN